MSADGAKRLLIVTGAGASVEIGKGSEHLPLFADWINMLRADLDDYLVSKVPDFAWEPDGFEKFLTLLMFPFSVDGAEEALLSGLRGISSTDSALLQEVIKYSLWERFGYQTVDPKKTRQAYAALFDHLGISKPSLKLAYATTNYDWAFQIALQELGHRHCMGFVRSHPFGKPRLDPRAVERLAHSTLDAVVPVLNLHGAVGWYWTNDRSAVSCHDPGDSYQSVEGLGGWDAAIFPVVDKASAVAHSPLACLWEALERLLASATHVLVIGHAMRSTEPLVSEIAAAPGQAQVLVSLLDGEELPDELRGRAEATQIRFGPDFEYSGEPNLSEWLHGP